VIYKNVRHHPTRVFAVTKQTKMSVVGMEYLADQPLPVEARYLHGDFQKIYPYLVWAPDEIEMAIKGPPSPVKKRKIKIALHT
jgi:hypothetical protein